MYLKCIFCSQYNCCFGYEYHDKMGHILTHSVGGTMQTLQIDLKKFVNANIGWFHKACAVILSARNLKVNEYGNQLIEPHFSFDKVAITIVCKMYNVHCLVLCNQTYWTTRSHANYTNCVMKLAYFGNGLFKKISISIITIRR